MENTVYWDKSGIEVKIAVVELCGWRNAKNKATPTGLRIAKTSWNKLSPAAVNVLTRHGIVN